MATSGSEAGEGVSSPAEAIVGSALMALRSDLCDFSGWVVTLQEGSEETNSGDKINVTISGDDADGERSISVWKAGTSTTRT